MIIPKTQIMSKSRIESFSDGVFSIILTLLVFNFQVPKLSEADLNHELYTKLLAMYPYCITYMLSFIMISMFWIAHHNLFHQLKNSNAKLLWINNIFLLFLAFLPFPTQVLGAYPELESASIFFGISMLLVSVSFSALRYYCYFQGKLANDNISNQDMMASITKGLIGTTLYIIAMVISAFSPDVTLSMYAMIPFLLFVPINVKWRHPKLGVPSNDDQQEQVKISGLTRQ